MGKPVLAIMAAGMGSRYGGLKQIDPVDEAGHIIMDFSLYDAREAGFESVVFIIKKENEAAFRAAIGDRLSKYFHISYAFQDVQDLPDGYSVPEGRTKPWGTAHAILSAAPYIDGPFAVINADDYYGKQAFQLVYDFLSQHEDDDHYRYMMVGYHVGNTVTENGHVARGVCVKDANNMLVSVQEHTHIAQRNGGIAYTEDDGATWVDLPEETIVSMNMWGFSASILREIEQRFPAFLDEALEKNPLKGEFFLPNVVSDLIAEDKATVSVLTTPDQWFGVTYKEDKPHVEAAIARMVREGLYPVPLWSEK